VRLTGIQAVQNESTGHETAGGLWSGRWACGFWAAGVTRMRPRWHGVLVGTLLPLLHRLGKLDAVPCTRPPSNQGEGNGGRSPVEVDTDLASRRSTTTGRTFGDWRDGTVSVWARSPGRARGWYALGPRRGSLMVVRAQQVSGGAVKTETGPEARMTVADRRGWAQPARGWALGEARSPSPKRGPDRRPTDYADGRSETIGRHRGRRGLPDARRPALRGGA